MEKTYNPALIQRTQRYMETHSISQNQFAAKVNLSSAALSSYLNQKYLKCGYFTVGGIMCGSLVGIFVGALAVNASLGYMILLLGAWGLCLYITSRSLMDDARREEAVLNQPAEEFDDPDELPPLYWEGYDRGYEEALESMAYTRPPRVRPPKSKKKGA